MTQLSDLRSRVQTAYGIASGDTQANSSTLTTLINMALREIANDRQWDWNEAVATITTVANQEAYSLPADHRKTMRIVDTNLGREILQATPTWITRYRDVTGIPVYWFIQDSQIHLVPTPSAAGETYEHVYQRTEVTLSSDTDEPNIPSWADDLVVYTTAVKLAVRLNNRERRELLQSELDRIKQSLADDARRTHGTPRRPSRRDWTRQGGF
jgi:hypothetical protein